MVVCTFSWVREKVRISGSVHLQRSKKEMLVAWVRSGTKRGRLAQGGNNLPFQEENYRKKKKPWDVEGSSRVVRCIRLRGKVQGQEKPARK